MFYLCLFLPVATVTTSLVLKDEMAIFRFASVPEKAGIFAEHYLTSDDIDKLIVVASDQRDADEALFYTQSRNATVNLPSQNALAHLPLGSEWLLIIGEHEPPKNASFKLSLGGFSLARIGINEEIDINFTNSIWPGIVDSVHGLSNPIPKWGTWSDGKVVSIEFFRSLPRHFAVQLVAEAFGPNVGRPFVVRVGAASAQFELGALPQTRTLEFSNATQQRKLTIEVPTPISPLQLKLSNTDSTQLGIALFRLRIVPLP